MAASVGDAIEVYWPLDKEYYPATITAVQPTSGLYTLSYFDGEVEDIHLLKETWRFLNKENPTEINPPLSSAPKIEKVGSTQKNHPEPALPAAPKICPTAHKIEEPRKPWESIASSRPEKNENKRPPSGLERKLPIQPKRRRTVPKTPLSVPTAVIPKSFNMPSSERRASLRQKGYRPELMKGLSEHSITKRRKRALSISSDRSDGSSSSSSIVDNEILRPALLLIARSIASSREPGEEETG